MYNNSIRKGTKQTKRKHTRQTIRKGYILISYSSKEKTVIRKGTKQTKRKRLLKTSMKAHTDNKTV